VQASIADIVDRFPALRIAVVVASDLSIPVERPPLLDAEIGAAEAEAAARFAGVAMPDIPGVQVWRDAYKAFGIRKTSYRSSVERLIRKVVRDGHLARINPFVDAYNAVSLRHVLPAGADDLDRVEGDLAFRVAREGDSFHALGQEPAEDDPPKPGEIVYADQAKVLCRRWNWYQDARSPVTLDTRRAVVTVQSLGPGDLGAAVGELERLLGGHCGARLAHVLLDRTAPTACLPIQASSLRPLASAPPASA
jgi:DNA/RNA-binding domain of Phe-tRNA-synthetase-like protein